MFSVISKVVDYFLDKTGLSEGRSITLDQPTSATNNHQIEPSDFLKHAPFLIRSPENEKRRVLTGKISHIFHGHGLVEGDIYFSVDNVLGEKRLQVNDLVHLKAVQHNEDGGWYAEELSLIDRDWDDQAAQENVTQEIVLDDLQNSVVLGKVTFFKNGLGKINTDIDFAIDDCKDGFIPMKGDWISATVEEYEEKCSSGDGWIAQNAARRHARNIHPSRQKDLEGTISALMSDHGYVNEEVYFTRSACLSGYTPRKLDAVKAVVVESKQGSCQWRALTLIPLSSGSKVYRSKQFQQMPESKTESWTVPGQRPKRFHHKTILPVKLSVYAVPEALEMCVMEQYELTDYVPDLLEELTFRNYVKRMSTLLYLEEIQMKMDIREFDMDRVCLHPVREFLALTVPGLAEGRPSLLIGDKIILISPSCPDGPRYEGFVHEMTCTDVHLKFSAEFHSRYNGEDYNVVFTFSRTPLRRCHQAVSLAVQYLGSKVLFPVQVELKSPQVKVETVMAVKSSHILSDPGISSRHVVSPNGLGNNSRLMSHSPCRDTPKNIHPLPPSTPCQRYNVTSPKSHASQPETSSSPASRVKEGSQSSLRFFNSRLNERQQSAVMKILLGQSRPMPYIIFGPPGTGKTITVVEAILQIFSQVRSSRILACTPSNSAADLIAERLHLSGVVAQTHMVRFNAYQRSLESIPESILKYCRFGEDLEMISRYRVIVSTCSMAGMFYGLGLTSGHFTHVFIDESGQATEPECLIPVGLAAGTDGQLVLAGDPKQLGPIVMSPFAKMYGLEMSFLERIMQRAPYQRDEEVFDNLGGFDPALVTMLVDNYRSHPSILELPSQLFYYSQLKPMAGMALTHSLTQWKMLPKSGFPVVFHGIRADDVRENNSPSWFNPGETMQVMRYLQGALKEGVDPNSVGIITPYRKQVEKIRMMMDHLNIPTVKVGSVEEFQGQERQVIIISTVRSNEKLVGFDVRHTLGFLSNPKRLNVAITRAQALLIIIGNPYVLAQDPNWLAVIQFCSLNGGYTGCDLPALSDYEVKEDEITQNSDEDSEENLNTSSNCNLR